MGSEISQEQIEKAADILKQARCAVALTGSGISVESGIPPFRGSGGHLQILGKSDGVTIAPVVFDSTHGASGQPTLREELAGQPRREVIYPEGLSVYKRGQLDEAAMRR